MTVFKSRRRSSSGSPRGLNRIITSPAVLVGLAFVILIGVGGVAPVLTARLRTVASVSTALEDGSFSDRLYKWKAAALAASERPVTGWGLGSWLVMQGRWTHRGYEVSEVLARSVGHENIAHNYYVQWAADAGGVGLALHVATIAAFFFWGLRAAPRMRSALHRTLLLGCIAAVAGALVDMIGSPAYNYPGVYCVLWLWMGIGMAAALLDREEERGDVPDASGPLVWGGAAVAGLLVVFCVLGVGWRQQAAGRAVPRGLLSVWLESPPVHGPVRPGTTLIWTARYRDHNGKPQPTMPGTLWTLKGEPLVVQNAKSAVVRLRPDKTRADQDQSGFRATVAATPLPVYATATYQDEFGRTYKAAMSVRVQTSPPAPLRSGGGR